MRYLFGFLCVSALGLMPLVGCSETNGTGGGGGGGTGGTGGSDTCVGGLCESADVKIDCEAAVATCIADAEIDLTPEECDAASTEFYCNRGTGGNGGNGGNGGADGGNGGADGGNGGADGGNGGNGGADGGNGGNGVPGCNVLACENNDTLRDECEDFVTTCVKVLPNRADECVAFGAAVICNIE